MSLSSTQIDRGVVHERVAEAVRQLLGELGSHRAFDTVRSNAHLDRDLGLGSLERVELLLRVSQAFGVHLPDPVVAEADTVEDVIHAVLRATSTGARAEHAPPEILSSALRTVRRAAEDSAAASTGGLVSVESAETLVAVLELHAQAHPAKPHILLRDDDGSTHQVTFGELYARAAAVARGLRERGLAPAQTVAIMLPTSREFFYSFYGVLLAGGIPVPIYPPFRADRIEEYAARQAAILRNAEARLLITFRQAEAVARLLKPLVPSLAGVVNAAKLAEAATAGKAELHQPRAADIAFLQYTSGSTGDPKGVVLTHANLLANIRAMRDAVAVSPDDVVVSWLPLYHDMGLIGAWLTSLYCGIPVAVMSPLAFLTRPERWLWAFHHHRGTIAAAPNFAYELCVRKIADRDIEGLDLRSCRAVLNGAEPVNPETLDRFLARFARYGFRPEALLPVYGLAEASLAVTVPPLGRRPLVDRIDREIFQGEGRAVPISGDDTANTLAFVSVGLPLPRHEVRIVDEQGNQVEERVEGNLWFRGPSSTRGYYRNPEATAELLPEAGRAEGWVDSGDRAYRAGGEIYITGRVKDIIIKAGRNLYPHEVEEISSSVAGVRKGGVVAFGTCDDTTRSERLIIVAETRDRKPDARATDAITAEMTSRIAESVGVPPDVIELVPPGAIPKTSSGKLRRSETRQLYLAGKLGKGQLPAWLQVARLSATSGAHTARSGLRRVFELFFGFYSAAAFAVFIVPTWLLAYLAPTVKSASRITQIGTRIFFRMIFCAIRIEGQEHINGGGPFVFVSNHTSFLDVVLILATFKLPYRFVSKMEVGSWPFIGTFIRKRTDFTFNRDDRQARLEQAEMLERSLREGVSLFVFPEGTFVASPGVRPFQLGAFKAAVATGTPVCPVGLRGVREIYRDETRLPKPGSITITICPPIAPHAAPGNSDWQELLRLRNAARAAISRHCGEHLL